MNLKQLTQLGILASPGESEEAYYKRVERFQGKKTAGISSKYSELVFGFTPSWVEVSYSKDSLRLWEGGYFCYDGDQCELVLHPALKNKDSLWGLYSKHEIISHEMVHAMRAPFDEPIFEEHLAYMTSKSTLRAFLGPLFRTPRESFLFLSFTLLGTLLSLWTYVPTLALLGYSLYLLARLTCNNAHLKRAHKALSAHIQDEKRARSALLFLQDSEILLLSKKGVPSFLEKLKSNQELRLKQLNLLISPDWGT